MNWQSWSAFWAMGGHGLYVWGSTGAVLGAVAIELWGQVWQRRAILRGLGEQA
jgi:heme exporter protein D